MKNFNQFLNEKNIIFVRTNKFDNSNTVRKLPYNGIQCWAIYKKDFDKYVKELELWGGNKDDIEILNTNGYEIFALNYKKSHDYVIGKIKEPPKLIPFNKKFVMKFIKQKNKKNMLEYVSELGMGKLCY